MRGAPPEVVATWPAPNYDNPETRGPALLIVELTIMPLAVLTLLARLYVRLHKVHKSGLDDWIMVAAMACSIGVTVCVILADQFYGWNIHVWDLTQSQATKGRQVSIAAQTLFLFASGLAKTSILISYLRIAPLNSWFRRLTYAAIALVLSLIVVFMVVLWTQCRPVHAYWDLIGSKDCSAEGPPLMGQSFATVITDFLVYVLPLPTLIRLKLPFLQRLALIVLFSLGFVVVLAACMRTYWAHDVVDETYDVTWAGFHLWIWTAVEANLGVICGCVPALRPLFRSTRDVTGARSSAAARSDATPKTPSDTCRRSGKSWTGNTPYGRVDDLDEAERGTCAAEKHISNDSPETTIEMKPWLSKKKGRDSLRDLDHQRPQEMAGPLSR